MRHDKTRERALAAVYRRLLVLADERERGQAGSGKRCPVCGEPGEFARGVWRCACHPAGGGDDD